MDISLHSVRSTVLAVNSCSGLLYIPLPWMGQEVGHLSKRGKCLWITQDTVHHVCVLHCRGKWQHSGNLSILCEWLLLSHKLKVGGRGRKKEKSSRPDSDSSFRLVSHPHESFSTCGSVDRCRQPPPGTAAAAGSVNWRKAPTRPLQPLSSCTSVHSHSLSVIFLPDNQSAETAGVFFLSQMWRLLLLQLPRCVDSVCEHPLPQQSEKM